MLQGEVVLGGDGGDLRKSPAGHAGEVVVFVVVAHIPADVVQAPVIGVRLLSGGEHVVLGDEVAGHGVEAHAEECGEGEVEHGAVAEVVSNDGVSAENKHRVEGVDGAGSLGTNDHGAEGVEEGLAEEPDGLKGRVGEEPSLPGRGDVHVLLRVALELVVLHVVPLEHTIHNQK